MIRLLSGDARDVLAGLAAESVQCVVTSPPYYGLRSYLDAAHADKHCEIGSEATPDLYLQTMVGVFREIRRVLRSDGTVWCNLGDSYSGSWGNQGRKAERGTQRAINGPMMQVTDDGRYPATESNTGKCPPGYKPKDLMLMPARLALALQGDGWWVRSDIIWHKPNPMPESTRDRPTSAYEHVFLLTRSARYYYDADAVREPGDMRPQRRGVIAAKCNNDRHDLGQIEARTVRDVPGVDGDGARNLRNVWTIATSPFSAAHFATFPPGLAERCIRAGTSERGCCAVCGKPWVRQMQATGGILGKSWHPHEADAVKGNAPRLGIHNAERDGLVPPYQRTTTGWQPGCKCYEIPAPGNGTSVSQGHSEPRNAREQGGAAAAVNSLVPASGKPLTVPCTVLDPFAGAGTTLLVADRLQRDAVGIELNVDYTRMAMDRCRADAPLFADLGPAPEHPVETEIADLFAEAAE